MAPAEPADEPWKHPDELPYIRPEWTESEFHTYLFENAFSVHGRTHREDPWCAITLPPSLRTKGTSEEGDGSGSGSTRVVVPKGYRLPLMFAISFQWESLKLVMSSRSRDEEWEDYKWDILHVSRLCHAFLEAACKAGGRGTTMNKTWRCPLFDRAITRYYRRWLVNRDEFLHAFWEEFGKEEYEEDVCKKSWLTFVLKGHKGFCLTREEVNEGLKWEEKTKGLELGEDGKMRWILPEVDSRPNSANDVLDGQHKLTAEKAGKAGVTDKEREKEKEETKVTAKRKRKRDSEPGGQPEDDRNPELHPSDNERSTTKDKHKDKPKSPKAKETANTKGLESKHKGADEGGETHDKVKSKSSKVGEKSKAKETKSKDKAADDGKDKETANAMEVESRDKEVGKGDELHDKATGKVKSRSSKSGEKEKAKESKSKDKEAGNEKEKLSAIPKKTEKATTKEKQKSSRPKGNGKGNAKEKPSVPPIPSASAPGPASAAISATKIKIKKAKPSSDERPKKRPRVDKPRSESSSSLLPSTVSPVSVSLQTPLPPLPQNSQSDANPTPSRFIIYNIKITTKNRTLTAHDFLERIERILDEIVTSDTSDEGIEAMISKRKDFLRLNQVQGPFNEGNDGNGDEEKMDVDSAVASQPTEAHPLPPASPSTLVSRAASNSASTPIPQDVPRSSGSSQTQTPSQSQPQSQSVAHASNKQRLFGTLRPAGEKTQTAKGQEKEKERTSPDKRQNSWDARVSKALERARTGKISGVQSASTSGSVTVVADATDATSNTSGSGAIPSQTTVAKINSISNGEDKGPEAGITGKTARTITVRSHEVGDKAGWIWSLRGQREGRRSDGNDAEKNADMITESEGITGTTVNSERACSFPLFLSVLGLPSCSALTFPAFPISFLYPVSGNQSKQTTSDPTDTVATASKVSSLDDAPSLTPASRAAQPAAPSASTSDVFTGPLSLDADLPRNATVAQPVSETALDIPFTRLSPPNESVASVNSIPLANSGVANAGVAFSVTGHANLESDPSTITTSAEHVDNDGTQAIERTLSALEPAFNVQVSLSRQESQADTQTDVTVNPTQSQMKSPPPFPSPPQQKSPPSQESGSPCLHSNRHPPPLPGPPFSGRSSTLEEFQLTTAAWSVSDHESSSQHENDNDGEQEYDYHHPHQHQNTTSAHASYRYQPYSTHHRPQYYSSFTSEYPPHPYTHSYPYSYTSTPGSSVSARHRPSKSVIGSASSLQADGATADEEERDEVVPLEGRLVAIMQDTVARFADALSVSASSAQRKGKERETPSMPSGQPGSEPCADEGSEAVTRQLTAHEADRQSLDLNSMLSEMKSFKISMEKRWDEREREVARMRDEREEEVTKMRHEIHALRRRVHTLESRRDVSQILDVDMVNIPVSENGLPMSERFSPGSPIDLMQTLYGDFVATPSRDSDPRIARSSSSTGFSFSVNGDSRAPASHPLAHLIGLDYDLDDQQENPTVVKVRDSHSPTLALQAEGLDREIVSDNEDEEDNDVEDISGLAPSRMSIDDSSSGHAGVPLPIKSQRKGHMMFVSIDD
ncbi:hypothetical protein H0H92_000492 [Tricholoma furcatifolium]|nr:hypothetical protein H0H92_000492 [Tricholoma furcatifolium]